MEEITFMGFFMICGKKIKLITAFAFIFGGAALAYCLLTPEIYKAECRILPPSQGGGMASAMLAQMGGGGLSSLAGLLGKSTNGEMLIGVLRGQTVVDKIIDRFDLMEVYEKKYRVKMRDFVISNILHAAEDARSGIVTVAVLDEDPVRAAQMANAFVDELKNVMQSLAIGEAAQRRLFFERQMLQARKTMDEAEDELQRYQEKSGLVAIEPQFEAMVSAIADLHAQITAKEVEISSLRTYASGGNPNLKRAETELAAMRGELEKLERAQKSKEPSGPDGNTQTTSLREAPQLGLEYLRKLRDVKYAAAMYELMTKQFEAAKIDEAREATVVQIVDPATPPDYKFKPKIALIVVFVTLLGLCLGISWALFADYIETMKQDPEQAQVLKEIKAAFSFRKRQC